MSITSSERSSANRSWFSSRHISEKSYDFRILVSIAVVAIGTVVAICALSGHPGVNPNELGLMTAYP
jgi:hypothetical protein